jgi:hypothetical protein
VLLNFTEFDVELFLEMFIKIITCRTEQIEDCRVCEGRNSENEKKKLKSNVAVEYEEIQKGSYRTDKLRA